MCYQQLLYFFFNDTATTEIYTLSLHDALPISARIIDQLHFAGVLGPPDGSKPRDVLKGLQDLDDLDRKSTRLNSSHLVISYAVFCLKKKIHKYLISLHNHVPVHDVILTLIVKH